MSKGFEGRAQEKEAELAPIQPMAPEAGAEANVTVDPKLTHDVGKLWRLSALMREE